MSGPVELAARLYRFVDPRGPEDMPAVREMIREAGIEPGVHVGDDPATFDQRKRAEWWIGQLAHIIDSEAWFAMNTLMHMGEQFTA